MIDSNERVNIDYSDIQLKLSGYTITLNNASHEPPRFPWDIEFHSHNSYEIHFIINGKGNIITADATYPVEKGMVIITGPDVFHAQTSEMTDSMEEYCINISIVPLKGSGAMNDLNSLLRAMVMSPFYIGRGLDCEYECHELLIESMAKAPGYHERIRALLLSTLIKLTRLIKRESGQERLQHSTDSDARAINRKRVIDSYLRSYKNNLNMDELAHMLYISRRQLDRIFKEYYAMSLTEKVTSMRLEYAKHLLSTTPLTVSETAIEAGFSSLQYFYKCFKKLYSTTPTQYRKKINADREKAPKNQPKRHRSG